MAAVPKNDFCINFYYKKKLRFFGVLFEHKRGGRRDVRTHKPFFTIINRFLLIRKAGERLQNKGIPAYTAFCSFSLRQSFRFAISLGRGAYLRSQPSWSGKQLCILSSQHIVLPGLFWEGTASASDTERENFNVSLSALCEDGS